MAKVSQQQLKVLKECDHLNSMIEKGFPVKTAQGDDIIRFEVAGAKLIPILKQTA